VKERYSKKTVIVPLTQIGNFNQLCQEMLLGGQKDYQATTSKRSRIYVISIPVKYLSEMLADLEAMRCEIVDKLLFEN
jgi:hypothetical protein